MEREIIQCNNFRTLHHSRSEETTHFSDEKREYKRRELIQLILERCKVNYNRFCINQLTEARNFLETISCNQGNKSYGNTLYVSDMFQIENFPEGE